jgi:site-specific DNA-methyltransferase (adenine-specific)
MSDTQNRSLVIPSSAVAALPDNWAELTITQVYQIDDIAVLDDARRKMAALKRYVKRKEDQDKVARTEIETRAHIGDLLGPNPGSGRQERSVELSHDNSGLTNIERHEFRLLSAERNFYRRQIRNGELRYREIIRRIQRKRATATVSELDLDDRYDSLVSDVTKLDIGQVDAIVTDPPYPQEYLWTFKALSESAARLLKPGGLCVVMSGQSYLPSVIEALGTHLDYYWTGAYMLPGQPTPLRQRNVNSSWKPLLIYSNGPTAPRMFGDVMRSDRNEKDWHKWGQSESGMLDIIGRLTEPGDLILDPFVGGGATAIAALASDRRVVVSDIAPEQVALCDARVAEWADDQTRTDR